jgi:signal transduction histidine kinase
MKQTPLEPGLLHVLRVFVVVTLLLLPLIWRAISILTGIEAPLGGFLTPGEPVLVFMVLYLMVPWWQRNMGRFFLPVAILLLAIQAIVNHYLALFWLVPPPARPEIALIFMVRIWASAQFLVLFVAWQYDLFWALVAGIGITLLDAALNFPFIRAGADSLYPFYTAIVIGRLLSVNVVGLGFAWLMKRQRQQRAALAQTNQKLAEANQKLVQYAATNEQLAVSQERIRLARELHDTLAHSLSSITVQLEAAESIWGVDMTKVRTLMDGALSNTRTGLAEARRALQALRAGALEEVGLRVAVGDLARSAAARGNLTLDLKLPDELPTLAQAGEQCVYRVAQEALSNVTRHARATHIRVELQHTPGQLTLTIADNGKGFDMAQVNGGHFGLQGLYERADLVGAKLEVISEPKRGTTLTLHAPIIEMDLELGS